MSEPQTKIYRIQWRVKNSHNEPWSDLEEWGDLDSAMLRVKGYWQKTSLAKLITFVVTPN